MELMRVLNGIRRWFALPPLPDTVVIDGVEMRSPYWREYGDEAIKAGIWRKASELPRTLRVVSRFAWQASPRAFVAILVLQLLSGIASATGLLATTRVLTALLAVGPTPDRVLAAAGQLTLVVVAFAGRGLVVSVIATLNSRITPVISRLAEDEVIATASRVELAAYDDADHHDLLSRAQSQGVSNLTQAYNQAVGLLTAIVTLAAAVGAVSVLHPLLALVLLCSVLPDAWATLRGSRLRYISSVRRVALYRRKSMLNRLLTDRDAAAEIRSYTAQPTLIREHRRVGDVLLNEQIELGKVAERIGVTGRTISGLAVGAGYVVLGWLLYAQIMPLAVAGAAVLAMRTGRSALSQLVLSLNRLHESGMYIGDMQRFLTEATARTRPATGRQAPADPEVIELDRVTFSYPDASKPALSGVSATIRRGQVVALVGENGSGKSTLAKLLSGLYLPQSGSISWDGVDLAEVDESSIADRVAVIMQDPTRWPLTARDNVRLGRPDREDPQDLLLLQAATGTGAAEVAEELDHGWDTLLSKEFKNGQDLSGGQWQRMAAARAVYRDAPILICDEPTAALDARAEAAVYETLRLLSQGRTVFLITHRLASVKHADQILVLHHGELIEQGTHPELLAAGGRYADLYTLQAKAYQPDELTAVGA
ncbi:ABC transporter ATP-binding protein [Pseudonocardiaceae bacterium YIM PH 21723]|nr:ABC transporter ATP-binding protein [Pseudonocardiaceae bacterium YIM PH 21723]